MLRTVRRRAAPIPRLPAAAAIALALLALLAGCGRSGPAAVGSAGAGKPRFTVVAAEDFWGSIAAQVAGRRASVRSVIVDPNTDPHSYQPAAGAARAIAGANMVIVNGAGYDAWAQQLLQASPASGRVVLDVAKLLHLPAGANPHRWYFPGDVHAVVTALAADYARLDPPDAGYFAAQARSFENAGLARYDQLRREIRTRYAGVPVGYSESIFESLGEDLGLRLLTPYSFAKAIAEGTDVTAQDKRAVDGQARGHRIEVWVYNSQNVTPDVRRVNQIAAARGIPVATVTETLSPAGASFQQWQDRQLEGLLRALRLGAGASRSAAG
jgi:zinc/manganese transport system substrate-binding protein